MACLLKQARQAGFDLPGQTTTANNQNRAGATPNGF
jgi:hypothetical protein